jgi:succinoglycan biosynthesis protein ExoA
MSSPVGVGGASHRFEDHEGFAESTAFPAFRRWVFDRIGLFDEQLVRNQDDELNFRIHEGGGKIFISPRVKYDYYVRGSARALFRQYMQYAYWKVEVMRKHGKVVAVRHLVPVAFFVGVPVCVVTAAVVPPIAPLALAPIAAYGAMLGAFAVKTAIAERDVAVGLGAAAAAAIMHTAYGWGTIAGVLAPPGRAAGPIARAMQKMSR